VATLSLVAAAAALMVVLWPFRNHASGINVPPAPESTEAEAVSDPVAYTGVAFAGDGTDDWSDDNADEGVPSSDEGADL
jgi:hypothetical protein